VKKAHTKAVLVRMEKRKSTQEMFLEEAVSKRCGHRLYMGKIA
jgi:hypothetical protein